MSNSWQSFYVYFGVKIKKRLISGKAQYKVLHIDLWENDYTSPEKALSDLVKIINK